ncbi:hypothetical protein IX39_15495 [Chryseobacterium formosense]|uniref:Uncharacterized protein n=1 Tax=Chryseobacterium formosense TaxID=236814 RepID=A0A085Z305_9FLAO|nr:hypothetical protein [Chryseobacterium formosense]KFE98818.1 hypothetical protein IX39_15495 [Chryseobacterium formosense]SFT57790.1 hypothetical protein SAMN05421857_1794 [Chryseobacterium formosense]
MKKIFIGFALGLATLTFAQQYPNKGWDNDGYYGNNDGYYSDEDDRNYFPDDYYYNYPQDYYPSDYYQSYYNDYRQSIININWNGFFVQNRLNRWQIDQILYLNNLYASFSAWNNFYRYNPDRWYYDRFYAMERILGPRVFVVFQNNYYHGSSPIVYFQNYRRTHYVPRFRVTPRYRNVNINIYRVDRNSFRRNDNPTLNVVRNSGFRNGSNNSGGFRNENGVRSGNNGGFRSETPRTVSPRVENSSPRNNGNGGFRSQPRNENSSPRIQNNSPRQQNRGGEGRGSGFRGNLVSN